MEMLKKRWIKFVAINSLQYICGRFQYKYKLKRYMAPSAKKRLVVSFNNMAPELQEEVKAAYPTGYTDFMMRIEKPNGDFFFAVPFETEEISYLVKIEVKIDDVSSDDDDKDYYDDDLKGADELANDDSEDEPADDSADYDL